MSKLYEEVYLGKKDEFNAKLEILAKMAQPEIWSFGKDKLNDPYKVLRNYFVHTYNRLAEEGKILTSADGNYRCINTGLLTVYNQEIVAIFSRSRVPGKLPWHFNGFFKESDRIFSSNFNGLPEIANYFDNPSDLIFNKNLEIKVFKEHIIDDNYERFCEAGYTDKGLINLILDSAKNTLVKKLHRNFKLALPFYYTNTETGESKIQLLAPLYFPGAPVKLAIVLNRVSNENTEYYEAITVLPVEWAYMNSRLICKPDEEWAKIIENASNLDSEKQDNLVDYIE